MTIFAKRLKSLREEHNLTRMELAKAIGVSSPAIGRWESDERVPNIDNLILLCKFFNVSADYLVGLQDFI